MIKESNIIAKDLISDGLSVGYFYNFVKRIFENLDTESKVSLKEIDYPFPYSQTSLEIVIPDALNEEAIEKCKQYVFQNDEVRLPIARGRDMSFFVENLNIENKKIMDFPTTLESIIEFLKMDLDNLTGFIEVNTDADNWKEREKSELEKFKEVLEFLIENHSITNGKAIVRFLEG